jgi:hypothetical protein
MAAMDDMAQSVWGFKGSEYFSEEEADVYERNSVLHELGPAFFRETSTHHTYLQICDYLEVSC